jgi:hypothetical protein
MGSTNYTLVRKRGPGGGAGKEEEGRGKGFPRIRSGLAKRRGRFGVGSVVGMT